MEPGVRADEMVAAVVTEQVEVKDRGTRQKRMTTALEFGLEGPAHQDDGNSSDQD